MGKPERPKEGNAERTARLLRGGEVNKDQARLLEARSIRNRQRRRSSLLGGPETGKTVLGVG